MVDRIYLVDKTIFCLGSISSRKVIKIRVCVKIHSLATSSFGGILWRMYIGFVGEL